MDLTPDLSYLDYLEMRKKLLGSLVMKSWGGGVGLVIDTRRWHMDVHVKVAWVNSPFILFREERSIGWHNYTIVTIVSEVKYQYPI